MDEIPTFVIKRPFANPKINPISKVKRIAYKGLALLTNIVAITTLLKLATFANDKSSSPTIKHIVNPSEMIVSKAICRKIFIKF